MISGCLKTVRPRYNEGRMSQSTHTVTLLFTASVTDLEDNLQMQMKVTYAENSVNVPQVAIAYPS